MENRVTDDNVEILISDLKDLYGYDFSGYSRASLQRRIFRLFILDQFSTFADFRFRIRNDANYLKRFVGEITVNVTEMFRDPSFYQMLRSEIVPQLSIYPQIRIWHAGCSTGEEVFSMAMVLEEANLLHKSLLYATDINPDVLEKAKKGLFPINYMNQYAENYVLSGGKRNFSSYYTSNDEYAKFSEKLMSHMIFSTHNLATDSSFNDFQLIVCRNVLIYFDKVLQERVLNLFDQSLETSGFLALGSKEHLRFLSVAHKYEQYDTREKIWRKNK